MLRGSPIEKELQSVSKKNWVRAQKQLKSCVKQRSAGAGCRRGEMQHVDMDVWSTSQSPRDCAVRFLKVARCP
jgi:hypothetical protein